MRYYMKKSQANELPRTQKEKVSILTHIQRLEFLHFRFNFNARRLRSADQSEATSSLIGRQTEIGQLAILKLLDDPSKTN